MTNTKTRDVELSFHRDGFGPGHFAVNVKDRSGHREAYEGVAEADRERVYEDAREAFWRDLNDLAEETFGAGYGVYSEGRSGGWAVPAKKVRDGRVTSDTQGFTVETLEEDATLRKQCVTFKAAVEKGLRNIVAGYIRPAAESLIEWRKEQADEKAKEKAAAIRETRLLYDGLRRAWTGLDIPALPLCVPLPGEIEGIAAALRKRIEAK